MNRQTRLSEDLFQNPSIKGIFKRIYKYFFETMGCDASNSSFKDGTHKIALITGSLRKQSTNTGLLRAITELNHPNFSFVWIDVWSLPVFNEDLEPKLPKSVRIARDIVYSSDAVLMAIPEYNGTVSSPFKNTYDWLSRAYENSTIDKVAPLQEKLVGIMSSAGVLGGQTAQQHFLTSVINYCKVQVMPVTEQTQIRVKRWGGKFFDDNGSVIDRDLKKRLERFLHSFDKWLEEKQKQ